MLILVDDRPVVLEAYSASFQNLGQKLECFNSETFSEWVASAPKIELDALEAVLLGNCSTPELKIRKVSEKTRMPILALIESIKLDEVLALFEAGADDIIRKPMHIREILWRIQAIKRRMSDEPPSVSGDMNFKVFFDGRDAIVGGYPLILPRRERRLLEYFAVNMGKRLTKDQLFNAVYGIFEDNVHESVIESHISKLRKKLRTRIGFDPIDSKRHIGYLFELHRVDFESLDKINTDKEKENSSRLPSSDMSGLSKTAISLAREMNI